MNTIYLILGGNLGDRQFNLAQAVFQIEKEIGVVQVSSKIYETEPWGFENENNFFNKVVQISSEVKPLVLYKRIKKIESLMGRNHKEEKGYISRTIDIDILFYNNDIINLPELCIPHPRLHLRNFVLIPMNEIAPYFIHPLLNKTISQLLFECNDDKWAKPVAIDG